MLTRGQDEDTKRSWRGDRDGHWLSFRGAHAWLVRSAKEVHSSCSSAHVEHVFKKECLLHCFVHHREVQKKFWKEVTPKVCAADVDTFAINIFTLVIHAWGHSGMSIIEIALWSRKLWLWILHSYVPCARLGKVVTCKSHAEVLQTCAVTSLNYMYHATRIYWRMLHAHSVLK